MRCPTICRAAFRQHDVLRATPPIDKLDTSINGLLLAGSRVFGGLWLPIFAWSELASAEWLALGI